MSSPVSYANVAKGQVPEQELHERPSEVSRSGASAVEASSTEEAQQAESTAEVVDAKDKEAATKEKKPLAPAPVPSKSAWGSAANVMANKPVDEHKWPTPDKANLSEQQANATQKQQKFIKPITNKWVPINAKVILPSGRSNSQKQNKKNKNKKGGANSQKKQNNQSTQNPQNSSIQATNQPNANVNKKDGQYDLSEQMQQQHDGFKQRPNGQYQGQPQSLSQQKNARRLNNGNPNGNFKPRFSNQPTSQQQQQQQPSPQQNGFFHPQPFVQNQNYQNFNNRQFRPNQFRPQNNRNFQPVNGSNGFINGSMGLSQIPQQIPPPISPKQDPQQALTQQIDYYFSLENLIKDIFLRKNMNPEGWVSLTLILNFKRVKIIINGIQNSIENKEISSNVIILDSLKHCENLEINYLNGKDLETADIDDIELRVKGSYEQWLLPNDN